VAYESMCALYAGIMVGAWPERQVAFSYRLTGVGWSEARLTLAGGEVKMRASYLSDALGDLLDALIHLHYGARQAQVSWEEEPGEFRWLLARHGRGVIVRVLWFEDEADEVGVEVLRGRTELDRLIRAVTSAARAVLEEHGEEGYRKRWVEHPFPTFRLSVLGS